MVWIVVRTTLYNTHCEEETNQGSSFIVYGIILLEHNIQMIYFGRHFFYTCIGFVTVP